MIIIRTSIIQKIIALEWKMFQNIKNIGGRASCQDNINTFQIMRSAQLTAWSEDTLYGYLADLTQAEKNAHNLLAEKYARMMEYTSPAEYMHVQHQLPPIPPEKLFFIEQIVCINIAWSKELRDKFPNVTKRGRALSTADDTAYSTSIETYLKCELATYSTQTLSLYYQNVLAQQANNINGAQIVLAATVRQYGFSSLEQANELLSCKCTTYNNHI